MENDWTADAVRDMHLCHITNKSLAGLTGYTEQYISMLLNGKKKSEPAREKIISILKAEKEKI